LAKVDHQNSQPGCTDARFLLESLCFFMKLPSLFKKKGHLRSALVRRYRESHDMRVQRKKIRVSKIFLHNIKVKFWGEYKHLIYGIIFIVFVGGSIGLVFFSQLFNIASIVI